MKRPAFQFYPADWRKDSALQSCSLAAQGLWINMMCIAHECEPYGRLSINGKPMTPEQLGRLVGLDGRDCRRLVSELEDAGVFSRGDDEAIYSRRMVRDERIRNVRAEAGRLGGNPNLLAVKVNQTDNLDNNLADNQSGNQELTPSSSSSFSTSVKTNRKKRDLTSLPENWFPKPETMQKLAVEFNFHNGDGERYLSAFRDACLAKNYQYKNFDSAFSNCVRQDWPKFRNGAEKMPNRSGGGNGVAV